MKFIADFHVHTVSSGHAYSTIEEYVARAKKIGLKMFAVTDHGPTMPGAPHYYHFANLRMVPRKMSGVRILRGVEANIINDKGEIDLSEENIAWGELEIVMVTFHPRCGYENQGEEKNTEVLIKAIENPRVNIIAHPGNPQFQVNIRKTVEAAKRNQVLIEINNSSDFSRPGCHDRCVEFAREAQRQGLKVVVGTDSHISTMLGDFSNAQKLLKEAGLDKNDVVNTSEAMIDKYLLSKNKYRMEPESKTLGSIG
ncbi:MAG: PHP domain-containing protein [Candidatus Margulisiibacteriota bacterium]